MIPLTELQAQNTKTFTPKGKTSYQRGGNTRFFVSLLTALVTGICSISVYLFCTLMPFPSVFHDARVPVVTEWYVHVHFCFYSEKFS